MRFDVFQRKDKGQAPGPSHSSPFTDFTRFACLLRPGAAWRLIVHFTCFARCLLLPPTEPSAVTPILPRDSARLPYSTFAWATLKLHLSFSHSTVDFNNVCNKIWSQDQNRVFLNRHYRVSLQGRIYDASSDTDRAYSPLFSYVDRNVLNKPTFKSFTGK
jgi:hypothetical protein